MNSVFDTFYKIVLKFNRTIAVIGVPIAIILTVFVLLIVTVSAGFIFRSLRVTRKQKGIIEKQKALVDKKNIQITDSITYALTIQESILPRGEQFKNAFGDFFILYLPKDIVSGDFYWIKNINGSALLSAVDCTGHGVPGAFMSLHGFNHLEHIVNEKKILSPGAILDELNKAVVESLRQEEGSDLVKHGMDMGLLRYDRAGQKIIFSGAKNNMFIVSANSTTELKADRMSVGNKFGKKFTEQSADVQKGDMVYLFSDGYTDQKGGPGNKRFQVTPFKALLKSISNENGAEQNKILHDTFVSWKGDHEQVDDVLVIGVRI